MGSGHLLSLHISTCASLLLLLALVCFSRAAEDGSTGSADGSGDEQTSAATTVVPTGSGAMTRTGVVATATQQSEESSAAKLSTIVAASVGGGLFVIIMLLFAVTMLGGRNSFTKTPKQPAREPSSQRKLLGNEATPPASPYSRSSRGLTPEFSYDQKLEQGVHHEVYFDPEPALANNLPDNRISDSSLQPTSNSARPAHGPEVMLHGAHEARGFSAGHGPELNSMPAAPAISVVQPEGFDLQARRVSAVFDSIVTNNPASGGLTWDWPSFDDIARPAQ